jgi:ABC-type dipeptide/oligopeptide/nickel transport system permease subunit
VKKRSFWQQFSKNKGAVAGLVLLVVFVSISLLAPLISPYDSDQVFDGQLRLAPVWSVAGTSEFLLGTDDIGRDVLSRLIYGARISLGVGFLVVILSLITGGIFGVLAGFYGGWVDIIIMRAVDVIMSLPSILLAIVVVAILGPNLINGIIAVSIVALPGFIRIIRAAVMTEKSKLYMEASRSFGASHFTQIFKHIIPNCMAPIIVQSTLGFSDGILNVAALGFLGLGAQAPLPEWGVMLADARHYIELSPWMVTLPGVCILIVVLSFNILGDGFRDAFDPKVDD